MSPLGLTLAFRLTAARVSLTHESSTAAAGTYPRVEIDGNGHVIAGFSQINTNELPDSIPADLISGTLPTAAATTELGINSEVYTTSIANESISRRHFSDISIAYIQETLPTNTTSRDRRNCLPWMPWFRESTGQLYMYNGNAWHIVAGGRLTQETSGSAAPTTQQQTKLSPRPTKGPLSKIKMEQSHLRSASLSPQLMMN